MEDQKALITSKPHQKLKIQRPKRDPKKRLKSPNQEGPEHSRSPQLPMNHKEQKSTIPASPRRIFHWRNPTRPVINPNQKHPIKADPETRNKSLELKPSPQRRSSSAKAVTGEWGRSRQSPKGSKEQTTKSCADPRCTTIVSGFTCENERTSFETKLRGAYLHIKAEGKTENALTRAAKQRSTWFERNKKESRSEEIRVDGNRSWGKPRRNRKNRDTKLKNKRKENNRSEKQRHKTSDRRQAPEKIVHGGRRKPPPTLNVGERKPSGEGNVNFR